MQRNETVHFTDRAWRSDRETGTRTIRRHMPCALPRSRNQKIAQNRVMDNTGNRLPA
ncbi:hypothetical protein D3C72_2599310 [compost metagenome]